ncbi:MAG: hypothetical protein H6625_08720 [Bdellovibrionaceae bacterium]|nr:hypothetical protein [Pseudobdellovibrionaceae bacterium]MCB9092911.1 hypothetical protein [Halobacteriovoraceae bacterium]
MRNKNKEALQSIIWNLGAISPQHFFKYSEALGQLIHTVEKGLMPNPELLPGEIVLDLMNELKEEVEKLFMSEAMSDERLADFKKDFLGALDFSQLLFKMELLLEQKSFNKKGGR